MGTELLPRAVAETLAGSTLGVPLSSWEWRGLVWPAGAFQNRASAIFILPLLRKLEPRGYLCGHLPTQVPPTMPTGFPHSALEQTQVERQGRQL